MGRPAYYCVGTGGSMRCWNAPAFLVGANEHRMCYRCVFKSRLEEVSKPIPKAEQDSINGLVEQYEMSRAIRALTEEMMLNAEGVRGGKYAVYFALTSGAKWTREHQPPVSFAIACQTFQRLTRGPSGHVLDSVRIVCLTDDTTTIDWRRTEVGGYTTESILELRSHCAHIGIAAPFGAVGEELTDAQRANATRCFDAFVDACARTA